MSTMSFSALTLGDVRNFVIKWKHHTYEQTSSDVCDFAKLSSLSFSLLSVKRE